MNPILVCGGGISGITTAVEIAETGKEVILVEKESYLGGNVVRMNNYFPKLCPPACGLEINFRRIRQNQRIKVYTQAEIKSLEGIKGNYKVLLQQAPQFVNDLCTACGNCSEACPVEAPNQFNYGLDKAKAISLVHDMAFPHKFVINADVCKFEDCGECLKVCDYKAIDLKAQAQEIALDVDSVVIATGWSTYDAARIEGLSYADAENILTNVEFERLIAPSGPGAGELKRPSDQKAPKEIAFVQCAGSRDQNHLPYCSAVCCSASLKHARSIQEKYPDSNIRIFYIDLRVSGRNEDFLRKVQENPKIELVKGKVAKITKLADSGNLKLEAEDIMAGKKISYEAELVVLATGIQSQHPDLKLAQHPSRFLSEEQEEGIIPVACCKKPMDVSASLKDATAAALKAIQ